MGKKVKNEGPKATAPIIGTLQADTIPFLTRGNSPKWKEDLSKERERGERGKKQIYRKGDKGEFYAAESHAERPNDFSRENY